MDDENVQETKYQNGVSSLERKEERMERRKKEEG